LLISDYFANVFFEKDIDKVYLYTESTIALLISAYLKKNINIEIFKNEKVAGYAASKDALINLTRSISKLYLNKGVKSNSISLGLVETDMTKNEIKADLDLEKIKSIHYGRIGSGKDVANFMIFLISNNLSYISGQIINFNGDIYFT
tara:strand:+ start:13405 stop:13845 length:441 start_codon:yes stop_codon:yes gene_type:complete